MRWILKKGISSAGQIISIIFLSTDGLAMFASLHSVLMRKCLYCKYIIADILAKSYITGGATILSALKSARCVARKIRSSLRCFWSSVWSVRLYIAHWHCFSKPKWNFVWNRFIQSNRRMLSRYVKVATNCGTLNAGKIPLKMLILDFVIIFWLRKPIYTTEYWSHDMSLVLYNICRS